MIFACRQASTGEAAVARARAAFPGCKAEFAQLDLGSLASVRRFAEALQADKIDALICNAGLALMAYEETADGFEKTVGVCHIGHFLLARLLMPRLLASGAPRVVMVSSTSHKSPPKLDFNQLPMTRENFKGMGAYGQAKLCNVLMAKALQARYGDRGMTACALHPGTLITTDIGRNSKIVGALMKLVSPFTKNPPQGAATTVWGAVHEPASDVAGQYLENCHVVTEQRGVQRPRCGAAAVDIERPVDFARGRVAGLAVIGSAADCAVAVSTDATLAVNSAGSSNGMLCAEFSNHTSCLPGDERLSK